MTRNDLIREIETALNEEPNSLTETTELGAIEMYDSVGLLSVIALLDSLLDVVISPRDLAECKTISDILNCVKDKLD